MTATCDYCHKPLGLVRRLRGEKFCSVEHLDLYAAQQAEIALERLAASVEDRPILNEPLKVPRAASSEMRSRTGGGADEAGISQQAAVEVPALPAAQEMLDRLRESAPPAEAPQRAAPVTHDYPMAGFLAQNDPELQLPARPPSPQATLSVPAEGWGHAGRAWQLPAFQHHPLNPRDWSETELVSQVPPAAAWVERRPVAPPDPVGGASPRALASLAGTPAGMAERELRPAPPTEPAPAGLDPAGPLQGSVLQWPKMDGMSRPAGLAAKHLTAVRGRPVAPPDGMSLAAVAARRAKDWAMAIPPLPVAAHAASRAAVRFRGRIAYAPCPELTPLAVVGPVSRGPAPTAWPRLLQPLSGTLMVARVAATRPALRPVGTPPAVAPDDWRASSPAICWVWMPRPLLESERLGKLRGRLRPIGAGAVAPARAAAPLRHSPALLTVFPQPGFALLPLVLAGHVRLAFRNPLPAAAPAALAQAAHRSGGPYPKLPRRLPDQYLRLRAPRIADPFARVPLAPQRARRDAVATPPGDGLTPTRLYAANYFLWPAVSFPAPLDQLRREGLQRFARSADDVPRAVA